MSRETRGRGLLPEVADAVAAGQEVDWERCTARAHPAERGALAQLRTLEGICRTAGVAESSSRRAGRDGRESRIARRAVGVLVAIGLLESAVGLFTGAALLPAAAEGMLAALASPDETARGFLPVEDLSPSALLLRIVPHVLYPVCGLVLYLGGRFDRRSRLLGAVLVLLGAFWAQPVAGGLGVGLYPELFLPAVFWLFVREFPRVRRGTRLDALATRMALLAAGVGGVLQVANLAPVQALSPALGVLAREVPGAYIAPAFFGPHCLFILAGLAVLLLRVRGVAREDRSRTLLFVGGIAAALAPHVEGVVEVFFPGTVTVAAANWVSVLGSVSALAVPCLTLYAAIALRVLDVRTTVRVSARRLLTRGGLAVLTAGPLAGLAGLLASRADLPVRAVLADPLSQGCVGAAVAALVALAWRERLLAGLDGWGAPETADQRRALAAAGSDLGQATEAAEVEAAVARAARQGAGVPAGMLAALDASEERFAAPGGTLTSLPRTSLLAGVLAEIRSSLLVDPEGRQTAFELLPPGEAAWVTATGAAQVVPVAGSGATLSGLLVVGRRADGARLRPVDLSFLEALAAAASLTLARLRQPGSTGEAPPARACGACGRVVSAVDAGARGDACGGEWGEAPLPVLVAGKLAVERRIGAGGMGTVYRARDIGLDRVVAIKTLDGVSAAGLAQLRREAQAMAASAHPGVAQIYSLETWRGRPLLVMEHLDGGTLAARLGGEPLAPGAAAWVVTAVAEALDALHAAGYRHGDVKPSNIGFTSRGTPKLLDFGLAELGGGGGTLAGGTVAYLSPEALGGRPAGAADDVWALGVVLYETVAGRRPFGGATVDETVDAIRNQRLRMAAARPGATDADAVEAVLSFAGEMLAAPPDARPATAGALAAAVRTLVPDSLPPAPLSLHPDPAAAAGETIDPRPVSESAASAAATASTRAWTSAEAKTEGAER
ncbi:MAG: serine/threonine-protein kinase [Acidobacteria bacterium]|nr:serine/threonine-protein kinase [Acidobacteriota bacterium]